MGVKLFDQVIEIPTVVANNAPFLADMFLYSHEREFLDGFIPNRQRKHAGMVDLRYHHADALINYMKHIYLRELTDKETKKSETEAAYLKLLWIREENDKLQCCFMMYMMNLASILLTCHLSGNIYYPACHPSPNSPDMITTSYIMTLNIATRCSQS